MEVAPSQNGVVSSSSNDPAFKLAVAISVLRSKLLQKQPPERSTESEALRWKRKAKDRKQEILRLREELNKAEDFSHCDVFSTKAICKCYFSENIGILNPSGVDVTSSNFLDSKFDDVLRRRFLQRVRYMERRKAGCSNSRRRLIDTEISSEDEAENLSASANFLVELCDTNEYYNLTSLSHQTVDFILASLKDKRFHKNSMELVEGIVNNLVTRLLGRMCSSSLEVLNHNSKNVQHLIRKLGTEPFVGHRALLAVTQRICAVGEHIMFLDPFDDTYSSMEECLFLMIQLVEFMISDHLLSWSGNKDFENALFQQWVASILYARKVLELLENRNGLYVVFLDRVIGGLAKLVLQSPSLQQSNRDAMNNILGRI